MPGHEHCLCGETVDAQSQDQRGILEPPSLVPRSDLSGKKLCPKHVTAIKVKPCFCQSWVENQLRPWAPLYLLSSCHLETDGTSMEQWLLFAHLLASQRGLVRAE